MVRSEGRVETPKASNHLMRLCKHFSRKISVQYDEHSGLALFPWGSCRFKAEEGLLTFDCESADEAGMKELQQVLTIHVGMLSRRNPLPVHWAPAFASAQ
ncbi:hypothetical protein CAI21_11150 [Alkalilimnicola ehrlichii]|uniref:2,4-dihydroxyhept-2-ene-1,7-dioic acid aldolase n=1 Tax=Alkalilimnicola ehrlichii TaxID=351052 RepID=A0A3E0X1N5_9GAMM|nr:DUF2218 domain-containing protein [Alkalilimnicola ehrlichii]RFA29000.1 hypothetical protein CAI21_11150 [Alkalilimnicola ehrlichii]RFA38636.1 hypothetical protein CAL65_04700 [Alkalilimnicola ehrlichii]